jgi:PAS domain S-box-containing protein
LTTPRAAGAETEAHGAEPEAGDRWSRECAAIPANVGEIRRAVSSFAAAHGADLETVQSIALAVTEATTNAVLHAFVDREPGRLMVVAEPGDDCMSVRVIDDGRGMTPRADSPGLGLGLSTMATLATSCDIREAPRGSGTEVRLVFDLPGARGPFSRTGSDSRISLLSEVADLAQGAAWPAGGIERLVDLLVERVADAAAIDLIEEAETPRRIAARVAGEQGEEWSRWLLGRVPRRDQLENMLPSLRAGEVSVVEIDRDAIDALAHDEQEAATMAAVDLAYWINVPLRAGDQLFGSIGLGLRAERGPIDPDQIAFLEALGVRAASALAQTRLVEELRGTRRRLERILGALAEAVTVQDASGTIVYANPAAARLLGADTVDEVLASEPGELADRFIITREDGSPVQLEDLPSYRLLAGERATPLLTRSIHKANGTERWLLTKATMLDDDGVLLVNIIEDVTEAKEAELRQRLLADAGELLSSSLDYEETLQHVAGLAVPTLADWCAVDLLAADGSLSRVALAHVDSAKREIADRLHRDYPPDLAANTGIGAVLRTGTAQLWTDITDDLLAAGARDDAHLQLLREVGMRSAMIVALLSREGVIGAISFVSAESRRAFGPADLELAEQLARRAGVAIENARLYAARTSRAD